MVVKVYSTSWCPYCHVLMDWLDSLGVEYEEIDAEDMDLQAVPVTEIGGEKIVGLDRPAIKKALKSAGLLK
ncbi:glutaredoxin family protein [Candidatus Saccharibacteria bacterium]|nr:glutaredoxin family protein [Candidatus Saccharibacteria bacterium]